MNVIHRELRSTLKDRRIWVEKTESMNQVYRNRANPKQLLSIRLSDMSSTPCSNHRYNDSRMSPMRTAKSVRLIVKGALVCLSLVKWIRLGHPTLMVPSPLTGSIGRLYVEVGRWGGLPGCWCDIDAIMTRPFSLGVLRTTTGWCPIVLWQRRTLALQVAINKDETLTVPPVSGWKCLGFASITAPGWIFDMYEPGQYSGPGLLLLEVYLVHRQLFCITPPFSIQMHHCFLGVYRCHVLMGLGKICHWELHHPSNSFYSFQVRKN